MGGNAQGIKISDPDEGQHHDLAVRAIQDRKRLPVFVILTREPGEEIRFIHDRMPLIMPGDYVSEWIKPGVKPEELLSAAMIDMVYEKVDSNSGSVEGNVRIGMPHGGGTL